MQSCRGPFVESVQVGILSNKCFQYLRPNSYNKLRAHTGKFTARFAYIVDDPLIRVDAKVFCVLEVVPRCIRAGLPRSVAYGHSS